MIRYPETNTKPGQMSTLDKALWQSTHSTQHDYYKQECTFADIVGKTTVLFDRSK